MLPSGKYFVFCLLPRQEALCQPTVPQADTARIPDKALQDLIKKRSSLAVLAVGDRCLLTFLGISLHGVLVSLQIAEHFHQFFGSGFRTALGIEAGVSLIAVVGKGV